MKSVVPRMKFKTRLILGLLSIIAVFGVVTGVVLLKFNDSTSRYNQLIAREIKANELILKINNYLARAQSIQHDFIVDPRDQIVDQFTYLSTSWSRALAELSELNIQQKEKLTELSTYLDGFTDDFANIVSLINKNGYNDEEGLKGKFNTVSTQLIEVMEHHAVDSLYMNILKLDTQQEVVVRSWRSEAAETLLNTSFETDSELEKLPNSPMKEKIVSVLEKYRDTIMETMDSNGKEAGISEALKKHYGEMVAIVSEVYVPRCQSLILTIKEREKSYLLSNTQANIEAHRQAIAEFVTLFDMSQIDSVYKSKIEKMIQLYQKYFNELVSNNKLIAESIRDIELVTASTDKLLSDASVLIAKYKDQQVKAYQKRSQVVIRGAISVSAAIVLLGVLFASGLSLKFTKTIKEILDFTKVLNRGNLSKSLSMGNALSCSKLLNCTNSGCERFDKVEHCWVEHGSFSDRATCHHLDTLDDCRQCTVYKKGKINEFQEIASALNGLVSSLNHKSDLAEKIASGDLSNQVSIASPDDQLSISLKHMTENLNQIIEEVTHVSAEVAHGTEGINEQSLKQSDSASSQAAVFEELSSSMSNINRQMMVNAESARELKALAENSKKAVLIEGEHVNEIAREMKGFQDDADKISKIIKLIDEIAFQTNILSLNASVEAARAGVHGKGFAVVANEVRTLAGKTAEAAKETDQLISDTVAKIKVGCATAEKASSSISDIMENVEKVALCSKQIAEASGTQAVSMAQMDSALEQASANTLASALQANNVTEASEKLSKQAERLTVITQKFKLVSAAVSSPDTKVNYRRKKRLPNAQVFNDIAADEIPWEVDFVM